MSEIPWKILAWIGSVIVAVFAGGRGVLAYYDNRASEEHKSEQRQIDRLAERVEKLEADRDDAHDKIVEQGRFIANERQARAQAEAEVERLQGKVQRLQHQIEALRNESGVET